MDRHQVDILIVGGGIAGLMATAAFAQAGFETLCVDPNAPITDGTAKGADHRSTAFLQPAQSFMEKAGIWDALAPHAAALKTMRIIDAGGASPVTKEFVSSDISEKPFGWNFPNWLLRKILLDRIAASTNATFQPGRYVTKLFTRMDRARVTLDDGTKIAAQLIIAADGRGSFIRNALGIDVQTIRYGQKALAFTVAHDVPHDNISTEVHMSGGPFTMVPLPDRDGKPASAVVWMEDGPKALALSKMPLADFERALNDRSCGVLGQLKLTSNRGVWPIISQRASQLYGQHTALVAEAAHVVPPIGAQGLNMSLADMACLLELAQANPNDIGSPQMLSAYERNRMRDIKMRVGGIAALNLASIGASQSIRSARAIGLQVLHGAAPVRKGLMQLGLGAR
jgi:2-octaprenyl-6-methoxyphenol hydroxylase